MLWIRNVVRAACVLALSFISVDVANGLEIYVSGARSSTPVLGKLTINGSDVSYSEINTLPLGTNYLNLAVRDASSFYSIIENTGQLAVIDTAGNLSAPIGGTNLYTGLTTIGSTLYGSYTPGNTFGTINTSNGSYSSIGSLGINLAGDLGRMAAVGSTVYLTNGSNASSTFGTVNTGTGEYLTFNTGSSYTGLLLVASGSTLYGINSGTLLVSTINVGSGDLTPLNATSGTLPSVIFGAAVPEPSTFILSGIAGCVIAIASKRKLKGRLAKSAST